MPKSFFDHAFTGEIIETRSLADGLQATIRLTRADFQNKNVRQYTDESMEKVFADANIRLAGGIPAFGYDDTDLDGYELGHPEPVFDANGNAVGFDHNSRIQQGKYPAFQYKKFIYLKDLKETHAIIEPLMAFKSGQIFEDKLKNKAPMKFSLRALGDCEIRDGKQVCSLDFAEGGDAVKNPAMSDAQVLSLSLTDAIKKIKEFQDAAAQLTVAHKLPTCGCAGCKAKATKAATVAVTDSTTKLKTTEPTPNNSRDKSLTLRPGVSGRTSPAPRRRRTIGDAIMNPEMWKELEGMTDPEMMKIFIKGAMLAGMGTPVAMEESTATATDKTDPVGDVTASSEMTPRVTTTPGAKPYKPARPDELLAGGAFGDAVKKIVDEAIKTAQATAMPAEKLAEKLAVIDRYEQRDKADAAKKAVLDAVAEVEKSTEFEGRKLADFSEEQLAMACNIGRQKSTPDEAKQAIKDSLSIYEQEKMRLTKAGIIPGQGSQGITILTDAVDKKLKGNLIILDAAIKKQENKRWSRNRREYMDQIKKVNQPFVDELWAHMVGKNQKSFADFAGRVIKDDANLMTAADLQNQEGVFPGVMMRETFQKLTALQYVDTFGPGGADGKLGRQFKLAVKTFDDPAAGTTRRNLEVRAGEAFGEAQTNTRYNKFFTRLRGIAFRLGAELEWQMKNGPVGIDEVAENLSAISDKLARETDTMILGEFQHTADQFESVSVTGEAVAATEWSWDGGGSVVADLGGLIGSVTYGANVMGVAKLLTGNTAAYTGHPRPIVEPQTKVEISDANVETITNDGLFTLSIAVLGGITQVRGYLDSTGSIAALVPGTTPTYAIDNENGAVVFAATATSGADAAVRPTISYYYATNYNEFNLTPGAMVPPEQHYSGILRLAEQMSAILAGSPRLQDPDWLHFHVSIGRGAFAIADLFETRKSPTNTSLSAGFAGADIIGELPGLAVTKSNGQFFAGGRRAILSQRGSSAYAVSMPMKVVQSSGGIVPLNTTRVLPTPEDTWYAQMIDVVGTAVIINGSNVVIKHPSRSIRFFGDLASTTSA